MTYSNPPSVAAYVPQYDFFQEPLLFTNEGKIERGLMSPAVKALDAKMLKKTGMRVLAWDALGFVDLANSKHPVKTAADMKGLSFRVIPGSAPVTDAMNALGAQPVPLAFTQVYTALENGTIDGNVDPATTLYPSKQYEVAKYVTIMPFQYNPMPLLINNQFYESMPRHLRNVVKIAATKTAYWEINDYNKQVNKDVRLMAEHGAHIVKLNNSELATFSKALAPLRQKALHEYGKALFKAFGIKP